MFDIQDYEIACASIIGREHKRLWKNNQDAAYFATSNNAIVGVVCDGCSQGAHSEFGAQFAAHGLTKTLLQEIDSYPDDWNKALSRAQSVVLNNIRELAYIIDCGEKNFSQTIYDYFLFTCVGFALTRNSVHIFYLGDGLYALNDQVFELETFENNAPAYMAYALLERPPFSASQLEIHTAISLPRGRLNNLLVGSDGMCDFVRAQGKKIPGKDEELHALSGFWEDDRYFKSYLPINYLKTANRDFAQADWAKQSMNQENGLLPDDSTFITLRTKQQEGGLFGRISKWFNANQSK